MANSLDLKFELPTDAELDRQWDLASKMDRLKFEDQVVRAGAQPILARAKVLTPRGAVTGTSAKRSEKQKAQANWAIQLWTTLAIVVRKYATSGVAIIGPRWPEGNKAYFNTSPKGRRQWFWGRPTGRVVATVRNWLVQAFDETKPLQLSAMKSKLTQLIPRVIRGK